MENKSEKIHKMVHSGINSIKYTNNKIDITAKDYLTSSHVKLWYPCDSVENFNSLYRKISNYDRFTIKYKGSGQIVYIKGDKNYSCFFV